MKKSIKSRKDLIDWFNDQLPAIRKRFPGMLRRFESMDRSQLVAECCRLQLTAMDAFKDLWLATKVLKGEEIEEIRKAAKAINEKLGDENAW